MEIASACTPFRHWIIDGAIPAHALEAELRAVPAPEWRGWVRYDNDAERKRAGPGVGPLFDLLQSWAWLAFLEQLTGIAGLSADSSHYGGGLHVSEPGGYLQCHLDFAMHPESGLERRLNLLAYLNDCAGGETRLYDASARQIVRTVQPCAGRILIWECSEVAYHGAGEVRGDSPRVTAAAYYYTPPRPGCSPRRRALFVPAR